MRNTAVTLSLMLTVSALSLAAQTGTTTRTTPSAPAAAPNPAPEIHADLNQLMRGILYPAANVVFYAQADDPGKAKFAPGVDPSMSTDPLTSVFGGWQAIENASLALAESANLLLLPGRVCSNGTPVPINDPAWTTFVQQVRDTAMTAYKAAQAKDQEKMIAVSEPLSASCAGCHRKWRDRKTAANRCK